MFERFYCNEIFWKTTKIHQIRWFLKRSKKKNGTVFALMMHKLIHHQWLTISFCYTTKHLYLNQMNNLWTFLSLSVSQQLNSCQMWNNENKLCEIDFLHLKYHELLKSLNFFKTFHQEFLIIILFLVSKKWNIFKKNNHLWTLKNLV